MSRPLHLFLALTLGAFTAQLSAQCTADAGTLEGFKPTDCLQLPDGTWLGGIPNGDTIVPPGFAITYFLSEGTNHTLVQNHNGNLFLVMAFGYYTVHTLVYDPATFDFNQFPLGASTAFDIYAYTIDGGGSECASFDLTGTSILIDNPDAGMITADSAQFCLHNGEARVSATPDGNQYLPTGYVTMYLLADANGRILNFDPDPIFQATTTGSYSIHTFIYDPNTMNIGLIMLGNTTIADLNALLIQGGGGICAALDVTGAPFVVALCTGPCLANAGTITADSSVYCFDAAGVDVSVTLAGNSVIPTGFQTMFVLINDPSLTIIDTSPTPMFTVSDSGAYQIHMVVYDPNTFDPSTEITIGTTSVWDLNSMFLQGGGSICANIGLQGAEFKITTCNDPCIAYAGTLTPDSAYYCQDMSGVWTSATPNGDAVVPTGYEVIYILTCGPTYVIKQFSPLPIFAIHDTADYTIHTLVYDPLTLNLSAVVFGSTVTADIASIIIQGGGTICADVDLPGAQYGVIDCANACFADAGTLSGDTAICHDANGVVITATPDGNMNVPSGLQVLYVLVDVTNGVVQQFNATPSFTVNAVGDLRIHTVVYDPNGFDVNDITPGSTTVADINGMLDSGGGTVCGAVDMDGALYSIFDCNNGCSAYAGWITPNFDLACYGDSTPLIMVATNSGNWSIPSGYQTIYLLSEGPAMTILQTAMIPEFTVNDSGDYAIHTLIVDPAFDINTIMLGTTTLSDINAQLPQGGGAICGSLDMTGAFFDVQHCDVLCEARAGTHTPIYSTVCLDPTGTLIAATPDGNQVIPPGYLMGYALTYTTDLIVQQASFTPQFTVLDTGLYTIHALVYDPITLNLSVIDPGTTAAIDLVGLLIQGGGTICASLDLPGASTYVIDCTTSAQDIMTTNGDLELWPNPAGDVINLDVQDLPFGNYSLTLVGADGRTVAQRSSLVNDGPARTVQIDVNDLVPGTYLLQLEGNGSRYLERLHIVR